MSKNTMQMSNEDRILHVFNDIFLILCLIVVIVPMMNVVSCAFSDPSNVLNGRVSFLPVGLSVKSFTYVFKNKLILTGYRNSVIYTLLGTLISVIITIIAAYPLSRRELKFKGLFTGLFMFTMLFGGGLIPSYLVVKRLNLVNTMWGVLIPNSLSVYNMIIARTFFASQIPADLYEAAEIDGAGDYTVFFRIALPLAKPILAVLSLFYAVGLWNMYFDAVLYLNSYDQYPLQVILKEIMTNATTQAAMVKATGQIASAETLAMTESLKYSTILCACVPMLAIYPFVQKYFAKGLLIGSLKG